MKEIRIILVLATSLLLSFTGFSQKLETQTSVDFKIRNLGLNVDGHFKNATVITGFDTEDVSQWVLSGSLKVSSIDTGNKKRDGHLLEEDYFDATNYPKITIESINFKKDSENNYNVTIKLTIKKTTKTIIIPMQIIDNDTNLKLLLK